MTFNKFAKILLFQNYFKNIILSKIIQIMQSMYVYQVISIHIMFHIKWLIKERRENISIINLMKKFWSVLKNIAKCWERST